MNANLTKGSASTTDVLRLLRAWEPGEPFGAFRARAVESNVLGKTSRSRAGDVLENILGRRFFPGKDDAPARHVQALDASGQPPDLLRLVLYYQTALAEHLLYLIATRCIYDLHKGGRSTVSTPVVQRFIEDLPERGVVKRRYSPAVAEKLAQTALTTLRDFGLLAGKAKKDIVSPRVPHEVVGYVAYALREEHASAKRIAQHDDWRLFLLSPPEAEHSILEAARHGHFVYSVAGDIRRFDWRYDSLDDYVAALAHATT